MKNIDLVPTGNLWQRLHSCWFLFFHPQLFIEGVIQEFVKRVLDNARQYALVEAHNLECTEQQTLPDFTLPSPELAEAAAIAAQEAVNG